MLKSSIIEKCREEFAILVPLALAGSIAMPGMAYAQENAVTGTSVASGEIVVSARRQTELLQDVPVSVQVLQGDALEELAITDMRDIQKVAPGLSFNTPRGAGGDGIQVTMRGVRWTAASGNPATPFFFNEAVVDPAELLLTLYDIEQIEVIRGPQGTTRGAPSISGAITIRTRRPDMNSVGGYGYLLAGEGHHFSAQAGVSIPIIQDKLAIRVAGAHESSRANRVYSVNSGQNPRSRVSGGRITALFEPTDDLSIQVMYQRTELSSRLYRQVEGTGSLGFNVPVGLLGVPRVLPPNFNGPPIGSKDYLSVMDRRNGVNKVNDIITTSVSYDIIGHNISYIFGYNGFKAEINGDDDRENILPGYSIPIKNTNWGRRVTHELRVSSGERNSFIDYVVGVHYAKNGPDDREIYIQNITATFLDGAFGLPRLETPDPFANPAAIDRYRLPLHLNIFGSQKTYSFFGNVSLHLPYDIEVSGGLRWIHDRRPFRTIGTVGPGFSGFPLPASLSSCGLAGAIESPVYGAGYCDFPVAAGQAFPPAIYDKTFTPLIYNVSVSKKVTSDILTYFTVGSSYRTGVGNIGTNVIDPELLNTNPEKATSFEFGIKSAFLNNRLRINANIFQIDYKGQITQFSAIPYFNTTNATISQTPYAYYLNADARVRGIEFEISAAISEYANLVGNINYAKMKAGGGMIPCIDPSRPITQNNVMNFCEQKKSGNLNSTPPFQATLFAEFHKSLGNLEGYVRTHINYQGHNPNFGFLDEVKGFAVIDLFAGLNGGKSTWEVGLYAKNVFDKRVVLQRLPTTPTGGLASKFGLAGYYDINSTAPREIGLSLRYAFGSR